MAGRKTSRRHTKIKKRKKGKVGKRKAKVVRVEAVEGLVYEPVKVTRADYKVVKGFCNVCGAKIYGDISLVNHASSHDSGLTISRYLSMSGDDRFLGFRQFQSWPPNILRLESLDGIEVPPTL